MAELSPMEIRLQANIAQFETQMKRAKDMLDKQAKGMDDRLSRTGRDFGRDMGPAIERAKRVVAGFARAAIAAGASVVALAAALRGVAETADRLRLMEGRLTAITGSAERAALSMEQIRAIANNLGVDVGGVADAFARFRLAADEIGATDDEVAKFTETLLKLGRIGGSSQEELANGMRQLSQGLAAGIIRAEEFNSVVENMPVVVQAAAEQLGLSMGELRQKMLDGELTAKAFFEAVLGGANKADEQFKTLPGTVEQASQRMTTALEGVALRLDRMVGASEKWAGALNAVADELDKIAQFDVDVGSLIGTQNMPRDGTPLRGPLTPEESEFLYGRRPGLRIRQNLAAPRVVPPGFDAPGRFNFPATPSATFPVTGQDTTRPTVRRPGGGGISAIDSALASIEAETRALERQAAVVGMNSRARAEYMARAELYDAAMKSGTELTDQNRAAIEAAVTAVGEATAALEAKQAAEEAATRAAEEAIAVEERKAQAMADGIDRMTNAIRTARSLDDALRNVLVTAAEIAAQGLFGGTGPAGNIMNKILGVASGGLFGMLAGPSAATTATSLVPGIGSIPMRAAGGPVSPGNRYLIGERGPEVFVPSMPGYIRPSGGGTGGGGNTAPVINIDARGAQQGVAQQIERVMAAQARNITRMMRQAQAEGR